MEEKYDLACKLQETILAKLGWKSVIEKSKGKGFHIFIFFNNTWIDFSFIFSI